MTVYVYHRREARGFFFLKGKGGDGKNFWRQEGGMPIFFRCHWKITSICNFIDKPLEKWSSLFSSSMMKELNLSMASKKNWHRSFLPSESFTIPPFSLQKILGVKPVKFFFVFKLLFSLALLCWLLTGFFVLILFYITREVHSFLHRVWAQSYINDITHCTLAKAVRS